MKGDSLLPARFAMCILAALLPGRGTAQDQACGYSLGTSSFTREFVAGQTNPISVTGTFSSSALLNNTWGCFPTSDSVTFTAFVEPGHTSLGLIKLWLRPRTSNLSYSFYGNADFVLPVLPVGDYSITLETFNGNAAKYFLKFGIRNRTDPAVEAQGKPANFSPRLNYCLANKRFPTTT
ncbi:MULTISPECIES: hypothetical protein [unclassified Roseateles]|uniref:hypothetical protein n=1 Tax=unclassified Roseateles TaxID=2626991 RepID=UPI00138F5E8B|nr:MULTISPECIES: hypothetical protein [unclassified Roseateles]